MKEKAKQIQERLKQLGSDVKLAHCLEALAIAKGYNNWNVLSADLKNSSDEKEHPDLSEEIEDNLFIDTNETNSELDSLTEMENEISGNIYTGTPNISVISKQAYFGLDSDVEIEPPVRLVSVSYYLKNKKIGIIRGLDFGAISVKAYENIKELFDGCSPDLSELANELFIKKRSYEKLIYITKFLTKFDLKEDLTDEEKLEKNKIKNLMFESLIDFHESAEIVIFPKNEEDSELLLTSFDFSPLSENGADYTNEVGYLILKY
jgi:hypothetical protein